MLIYFLRCILSIYAGRAAFLTNYAWQWSLVAGIVSYFWGVRSYQNVCMDKLMHLEHSNIADLKRKTIAMKYNKMFFSRAQMALPSMFNAIILLFH